MSQFALSDIYAAAWKRLPVVQQERLYQCLHRLEIIHDLGPVTAKEILFAIALLLADHNKGRELTLQFAARQRASLLLPLEK